ncbi:MAG TPA: hypothetical protein VHP56_02345 [Solirubrobacterales bacterium]|jgi:hypothetical protein|nr:hypothetical protein [Solirubrobacterales bacterium]
MEGKGGLIGGLVLLVLAVAVVGCGGGSSTAASTGETAGDDQPFPNVQGVAREFLLPGGDNLVQTFGEEASATEREKASKVVHVWMKARVAEDWAADCKYLAEEYVRELVWDALGVSHEKVTNCHEALAFFGTASSGTSGNTLTGPIDSLRVRATKVGNTEEEAYAQWHGPKGIDWVLPMRKELGGWRIYSASPLERTK